MEKPVHYHDMPSKYFDRDLSYTFPIYERGVPISESATTRLYSCKACGAMVTDTCLHEHWHEHA